MKRPNSWFMSPISDGQLFHDVYCHRVKELTDAHRKHLAQSPRSPQRDWRLRANTEESSDGALAVG